MQLTQRLRRLSGRSIFYRYFTQSHNLISHKGGCHCGALTYDYKTSNKINDWSIRECQCSFCRKHNSCNVSDNNGVIHINCNDEKALNRYQFGYKTCEFWICQNCGVFIGAISNDHKLCTINVNTLDNRKEIFDVQQKQNKDKTPMIYDKESIEQRNERRKKVWTPIQKINIVNYTLVNKESKDF